ncbi:MAG: hypothetical protein ACFBQW_08990 [Sphingomonadaceae bacterium]
MESNQRYYARRASEEMRAAARAVTPEAYARRRALAEEFARKAKLYSWPNTDRQSDEIHATFEAPLAH